AAGRPVSPGHLAGPAKHRLWTGHGGDAEQAGPGKPGALGTTAQPHGGPGDRTVAGPLADAARAAGAGLHALPARHARALATRPGGAAPRRPGDAQRPGPDRAGRLET